MNNSVPYDLFGKNKTRDDFQDVQKFCDECLCKDRGKHTCCGRKSGMPGEPTGEALVRVTVVVLRRGARREETGLKP